MLFSSCLHKCKMNDNYEENYLNWNPNEYVEGSIDGVNAVEEKEHVTNLANWRLRLERNYMSSTLPNPTMHAFI